jgi:hypothetical protein
MTERPKWCEEAKCANWRGHCPLNDTIILSWPNVGSRRRVRAELLNRLGTEKGRMEIVKECSETIIRRITPSR